MFCGLEAPPVCQNTSSAVCGHKVLLLKSPWACPIVIVGGFSAIPCSVRPRTTASNSQFGPQWSLVCSQLLRGCPPSSSCPNLLSS